MELKVIENRETAEHLSELLLSVNGQLIGSLAMVEKTASPNEFIEYRRRVGTLVNGVFESLLEPIYAKHPELKPPDLEM